jgi:hypothetical protein
LEGVKDMNKQQLKNLYAYLDLKASFEPLTDREQNEVKKIQNVFGIKACKKCKGEGYFYNPSITGYGYEEGVCKECEGIGEVNLPEDLKQMMKEQRA